MKEEEITNKIVCAPYYSIIYNFNLMLKIELRAADRRYRDASIPTITHKNCFLY